MPRAPRAMPCTPWLGLAEGRACAEAPHATARCLAVPLTRSPRPRALTGVRSLVVAHLGQLLVVYETTARTALQVWLRRSLERVVRASGGPTARPHATAPPATCAALGWAPFLSSCPPPDGRAWEDGWPVSAIPKLAIRSDRGLSRWGIPRLSHACSRPHCQHELSARFAPPQTPRPFSPDGAVFGIGFDDPRATWVLRVVDLHSRRPEGRADRR